SGMLSPTPISKQYSELYGITKYTELNYPPVTYRTTPHFTRRTPSTHRRAGGGWSHSDEATSSRIDTSGGVAIRTGGPQAPVPCEVYSRVSPKRSSPVSTGL